ncbi:MAG: hypothetical protein AAFZ63_28560 [Bacteroidota bacterium]
MGVSVERTEEAILIKLPLNTEVSDIQRVLNFFEYVSLVNESKANQEEIDELAREVNKDWWNMNKERFLGKEGFEDIE